MSMRVVLLDLGNSSVKWIVVSNAGLVSRGTASLDELALSIGGDLRGAAVLVASVASPASEESLSRGLSNLGCSVWFAASVAAAGGLKNAYRESEQMGVDRWLAMLGARQRTTRSFCVADAGSALTIDLVDADGRHHGGYIIPGLALMEGSLLANTDRVRFDDIEGATLEPGRSTAEAVRHGLRLAHCGAIDAALKGFAASHPEPQLMLCGGDGPELGRLLAYPAILTPDLVFEGLLYQGKLEGVPGTAGLAPSVLVAAT